MLLQNWNTLLWKYIEGVHEPGYPLYLAVDQFCLQKIFNQKYDTNVSVKDCEYDFLEACNSYIVLKKNKAEISKKIFQKANFDRSLCLSYAVQQIIAAEKMLSDQNYTANSYFPRYREVIGVEDGGNQIPIAYDQFNLIWKTLKKEILELPGASIDTVTFSRGKGINLNRSLPISQALLSLETLIKISKEFPGIASSDDSSMLFKLRRKSYCLPQKAQKKILNKYLSEPIIKQIRSFLTKSKPFIRRRSKQTSHMDSLIPSLFEVFIDSEGWDETYILTMTDPDKKTELEKSLLQYINRNKFLFFSEEITGEYIGSKLPLSILKGDRILIVTIKENEDSIKRHLDDFVDKGSQNHYRYPSAILPENYSMVIYEPAISENHTIIIGKTGLPSMNEDFSKKLELQGGLSINTNNNEYLIGYAPDKILFDKIKLENEEMILVNKEPMKVECFLEKIKNCHCQQVLSIECFGVSILIKILSQRSINLTDIGYKIKNNTLWFSPSKKISEVDSFYKHWNFYNFEYIKEINPISKGAIEINIKHFLSNENTWIPLNKVQIKNVLKTIRTVVDRQSYPFALDIIQRTRSIPTLVYKEIVRKKNY